jgi:hypothetical protein
VIVHQYQLPEFQYVGQGGWHLSSAHSHLRPSTAHARMTHCLRRSTMWEGLSCKMKSGQVGDKVVWLGFRVQIYLDEVLISDIHPGTRVRPVQSIVAVIAGLCKHCFRCLHHSSFFLHTHYFIKHTQTLHSHRTIRIVVPLRFSRFMSASFATCKQCASRPGFKLQPSTPTRHPIVIHCHAVDWCSALNSPGL